MQLKEEGMFEYFCDKIENPIYHHIKVVSCNICDIAYFSEASWTMPSSATKSGEISVIGSVLSNKLKFDALDILLAIISEKSILKDCNLLVDVELDLVLNFTWHHIFESISFISLIC